MAVLHTGEQFVYAEELQAHYLVARGHPAPERLRARLDEATGEALRRTLTTLLAQHIDPADDAIWLIRRLDIVVSMNAAWDPDQITQVWAQQIALALVQLLNAGSDGVDVIRFGSRAEYVSHFLGDLVAGSAWSRWYYTEFEGVRLLTQSAAIRTVVCQAPVIGIDALLLLPPTLLTQVIATLSVQDARQLLQTIPPGGATVGEHDCFELGWRLYEKMQRDLGVDNEIHQTLRLVLEVLRARPEWTGETLVTAIRALVTLIRVAAATPEVLPAVRRVLGSGRGVALQLYMIVSPGDAGLLVPLGDSRPAWLDRVVRTLPAVDPPQAFRSVADEPDIHSTPFGGVFLLVPLIAALPFEKATAGWPMCGDVPASALARLLVLAKCLGGNALPRLMLDAVIRDLLRIDPKLGISETTKWLAALTGEQLTQFQRLLLSHDEILRYPSPRFVREDDSSDEQGTPTQRFAAARRDVAYLAFPGILRESSLARRAFGRVAASVLRDLSRRLPGFARASFAHLQANFLSISASVEQQPNRRVVRLSRPPLDIILNMTGMSRATYRLPWLDDKPFMLFPESAR